MPSRPAPVVIIRFPLQMEQLRNLIVGSRRQGSQPADGMARKANRQQTPYRTFIKVSPPAWNPGGDDSPENPYSCVVERRTVVRPNRSRQRETAMAGTPATLSIAGGVSETRPDRRTGQAPRSAVAAVAF